MSDDHEHHAHIETPAPFLFCIATAIMFIGLVMATAGGEDKTGDTGYWFVFILGIMGMFTAFFMWIQDYWDQESEEDEHIEMYKEDKSKWYCDEHPKYKHRCPKCNPKGAV